MRLTQKINNNVALAVDGEGKELVVFGRGVGFPAMPYELTDLSRIQRTFCDAGSGRAELSAKLREEMVGLAAEIAELAQAELDCSLNPNLSLTLADHLGFAIERLQSGSEQRMPLACDIAHFYPAEMSLARRALQLLRERQGVALPDSEAVDIALHLIGSEMEHSDLRASLPAMQVVGEIAQIIEQTLHVTLDTASISYSRFVLHVRYLLEYRGCGGQEAGGMRAALKELARQSPEVYGCTLRVRDYLASRCRLACGPDEMLYLFLHINRLKACSIPPAKAGASRCAQPDERKEDES